jgi:hypothetical protein
MHRFKLSANLAQPFRVRMGGDKLVFPPDTVQEVADHIAKLLMPYVGNQLEYLGERKQPRRPQPKVPTGSGSTDDA